MFIAQFPNMSTRSHPIRMPPSIINYKKTFYVYVHFFSNSFFKLSRRFTPHIEQLTFYRILTDYIQTPCNSISKSLAFVNMKCLTNYSKLFIPILQYLRYDTSYRSTAHHCSSILTFTCLCKISQYARIMSLIFHII